MEKFSYPFSFAFDYDLLYNDAIALSSFQERHARTGYGKGYTKWEEGKEITHWASKLSLYKTKSIKDNPHSISIVNQCKKLFDAIGSKQNDIILLEYDSESFLSWHIDNGEENYGRINIVVTPDHEKSPIIFRENGKLYPCPAKLAVVNTYQEEHMYDNRGRDTRILLIMTTQDMNYQECVNAIKRL